MSVADYARRWLTESRSTPIGEEDGPRELSASWRLGQAEQILADLLDELEGGDAPPPVQQDVTPGVG